MNIYEDFRLSIPNIFLVACLIAWPVRLKYDKEDGVSDAKCTVILSIVLYLNNFIGGNWVTLIAFYLCIEGALHCFDYISNSIIKRPRVESKNDEQQPISPDTPMKPLIFPCQTSHTRIFPKTHSFSYSYLQVGIPVGWQGSIGSMLSADLDHLPPSDPDRPRKPRQAWFSVEAADYLERGNAHLGLQGKLHQYLTSEGECPEDYPLAYLVTAPRFLGYSSNPVSFWYLYNQEKQLKAMILEVNNTFDERRSYFSKDTDDKGDNLPMDAEQSMQTSTPANSLFKYKSSWPKDFHVSPFNSRKGSYALSAQDPFSPSLSSINSINNIITLNSSKAHAKLVARVFSTQPPIDPLSMTRWGKIRFLMAWWWVGFATFPRTVKEAVRLFFGRKLHVWFRPEVRNETIGRKETEREKILESHFRNFLNSHIQHSSIPLKYTTPCLTSPTSEIFYPSLPSPSASPPLHPNLLTLKILSPIFFSRLAHYTHLLPLFTAELVHRTEKDRSIWVSDPQLLLQLFSTASNTKDQITSATSSNNIPTPTSTTTTTKMGSLNHARWALIIYLRRPPFKPPHPNPTPLTNAHKNPIPFPSSPSHIDIDTFVLSTSSSSPSQTRQYRRTILTLLLSDYLAFGTPELLDLLDTVVRMGCCYLLAQGMVNILAAQGAMKCLATQGVVHGVSDVGINQGNNKGSPKMTMTMTMTCLVPWAAVEVFLRWGGIHAWGALKSLF